GGTRGVARGVPQPGRLWVRPTRLSRGAAVVTALVPALAGALIVAGLLGLVTGIRKAPVASPARPTRSSSRGVLTRRLSRRARLLLLAGVGVGVLGWLSTGWVLAIAVAPAAVAGIPLLLAAPPAAARIERLEAMEEWTRSLSGVLTVGVGLEQALVATLR